MKRWPFRRKACLLTVLIWAAVLFPSVSQSFISEDFNTYLEFNYSLLSEYMEANSPYLDELVEKSSRNIDEWMKATEPFRERWMNDPNYTYEDYRRDTREYYEEMRRRSSEYSKEYNENSRPLRNAYQDASAVLRQAYYSGGGSGGLTQDEFDRLMRAFRNRVQAELDSSTPGGSTPPPVPGNTAIVQRMNRYSSATGFYNKNLLNLYASADTDGSGDLSFYELEQFQRRLVLGYSYIMNSTALTPEEFLIRGGGDCEDWSIVTAGLLRFWDVPAYVGALSPQTGGIGHAICLIKLDQIPEGYTYYEITASYGLDGLYIPVDYESVGTLSASLFNNWALTDIYTPEEIYGAWM